MSSGAVGNSGHAQPLLLLQGGLENSRLQPQPTSPTGKKGIALGSASGDKSDKSADKSPARKSEGKAKLEGGRRSEVEIRTKPGHLTEEEAIKNLTSVGGAGVFGQGQVIRAGQQSSVMIVSRVKTFNRPKRSEIRKLAVWDMAVRYSDLLNAMQYDAE